MRHLGHHAADGRIVRTLNHLVQAGESQALDHQLLLHRRANCRSHPLQLNLSTARIRLLRRHLIKPQSRDCSAFALKGRDFSRAASILKRAGALAPGRAYNSCAVLPRISATLSRLLSCFSASKVALITLCGLVVPMDFVSTFCTPAEVITARTAPPAITPVPSGAGFSNTLPEPYFPSTRCAMLVWVRLTFTRFFLAASMALRMAWGTSLALP